MGGRIWPRMLNLMKRQRFPYLVGLIGDCLGQALLVVAIARMLYPLTEAALSGNMSVLTQSIGIVVVLVLVLCMLMPICRFTYLRAVKKTLVDVRNQLFQSMLRMRASTYEKTHSGNLSSRMAGDAQLMEQAYSEHMRMFVFAVFLGCGACIGMLSLDARFAAVMFVMGGISLWLNTRFAKPLRVLSRRIQVGNAKLAERFIDVFSGLTIIKMYGFGSLNQGFVKANDEVFDATRRRGAISASLEAVNYMLGFLNFGGMLFVGALAVMHDWASFGTVVAFIQLQFVATSVCLHLGNIMNQLQASIAGVERVLEILDAQIEPERWEQEDTLNANKERLLKSGAAIEFRAVTFAYPERDKTLEHISFSAPQGAMVALVGPSGGGKSTLLKLLLGLYPVSDGTVIVDGRSVNAYSLAELRERIAYVPQDACLLDGTVEDNLQQGCPNAEFSRIIAAAKAAHAHDFIMALPNGYRTRIGERGTLLSGGQRQRIALARALLKPAPILLLDEPTAALDHESEGLIRNALQKRKGEQTIILSAHRLHTVMDADSILVLKEGKVVQHGNHQQLLTGGGLYSELFSQYA